jgi:hypothetical protein
VETLAVQSEVINFTITANVSTYPVTVIKNKSFSLDVGASSNYDLGAVSLPVTNNNVTATESSGKLILSSTTGLTGATTATFGNTSFTFTTPDLPQSQVLEVNFD